MAEPKTVKVDALAGETRLAASYAPFAYFYVDRKYPDMDNETKAAYAQQLAMRADRERNRIQRSLGEGGRVLLPSALSRLYAILSEGQTTADNANLDVAARNATTYPEAFLSSDEYSSSRARLAGALATAGCFNPYGHQTIVEYVEPDQEQVDRFGRGKAVGTTVVYWEAATEAAA